MGTSGNREPPVLTRAGHSFPALLHNPRRAAGVGQRMTGFLPASRRRANTPYLVIPEPSWELARKGSQDPVPRRPSDGHHWHHCRDRERKARPRLRGARRSPGGLRADSRGRAASASRKPLSPRGPRSPAIGAPRRSVHPRRASRAGAQTQRRKRTQLGAPRVASVFSLTPTPYTERGAFRSAPSARARRTHCPEAPESLGWSLAPHC